MNAADTAWIMTATALVLFMTLPGLALFYGGLVRARNVLSVLMHCMAIACLMSVLWLVAGYSIAFGPGESGIWGGLDKAFLRGVDQTALSGTIPEILFFAFQMTFAVITPALIVGAYVERARFGFVMAFSAAWMLLVYAPVAHWIWGGGMLSDGGILGAIGVKDFAGGIVVHLMRPVEDQVNTCTNRITDTAAMIPAITSSSMTPSGVCMRSAQETGNGLIMSKIRNNRNASPRLTNRSIKMSPPKNPIFIARGARAIHWPTTSSITIWPGS